MHARSAASFVALCVAALPAFAAITGTVMNSDGVPVAGARVSITAHEDLVARRVRLTSATPEAVPIASTQTDSKGSFTLDSPKSAVVSLQVSAGGFAPMSRRIERDEDTGAIVLQRSETKRGTISSADGKPVANAIVAIDYGAYEYLTRTNAEGRYEAPDPKRATAIAVVHPDFAIDEKQLSHPAGSARDLTRTLSPGSKLTGRVVAADGMTPVANAIVSVDHWPMARSGEDGTFTIAHAPSRWTTLTARSEGMLAQLPFTKGSAHTLRLAKAAAVAGRVTDSKTKAPVAGAIVRVSLSRMGRSEAFAAETDAKGAYSLSLPGGSYMLSAAHPSYDANGGDISVTAGQQVTRDFAIVQLARVSGTVVDEAKRPVVAAVVRAEDAGDPAMRMMAGGMLLRVEDQAFSGPDGRFSTRVPLDQPLVMRATKRGLPAAKSEQFRVSAGERKTGVVLTIPTGIAVAGRVTDAEGTPLSGVSVTATQSEGPRGGMVFRSVIIGGPQAEEDTVRTASDGSFTLRVTEGTYDFNFRREGYAPKTVRGQSITFAAPATVETTLEPASEITGRVVRGGVGVEGVSVNAFAAGVQAGATTAADGSFALTGLAAGPLRVMLRKEDDFIQETRSINAPAHDVVVELAAGGRVTGRVVDKATGKPLPAFQAGISSSRSGGGMMRMAPPQLRDFNSEDGSFTLENVPAGATTLLATAPGYASARLNVTIEEGKTLSDVELPLDAGVRLTGRVTGPGGTPLSDVTVRVVPSATGSFATRGAESTSVTDANGEYALEALEAGEETISFSHANYVPARKEVTLKGRESRLDVQLSAGQRVTGVVVTEAGAPVADARVDAVSSGLRGDSAQTNANGTFEMDSLSPGRYRFTASKSGVGEGIVEDVDISSSPQVRITMRAGATIFGRVTGLSPDELQHATVSARSGRSYMSATPDATGSYRIEGAPTGTVTVSAQLRSRHVMSQRTSQPQTVEVSPGGSQNVDLAFRNDVTIRGRVIRNDQPLPSAHVAFVPKRGSQAQTIASASTDQQGQYSISGLEEGEYNVEVVDMQRYSPYSTMYTVRGSGTFDIDYRTSSIRGTVVDAATGEPITNASIEVRAAVAGDAFRMSRGAITDTAGTFLLEAVPPGGYVVTTSKDGYGSDVREMMVSERGDELAIKLSRTEGLTLKIVDGRDGRPVRAAVFAYDAQNRLAYDATRMFGGDDTGEVKLPLAPGHYTASVVATNYAPVNVSLQSPSAARVVAMTPGGTIHVKSKHSERRRIRLLDANGIPYPRTSNPLPSRDLLPSPGTTTVLHVAPGIYTLQLLGSAEVPVDSTRVEVREGAVAEAEI